MNKELYKLIRAHNETLQKLGMSAVQKPERLEKLNQFRLRKVWEGMIKKEKTIALKRLDESFAKGTPGQMKDVFRFADLQARQLLAPERFNEICKKERSGSPTLGQIVVNLTEHERLQLAALIRAKFNRH